MEYEKHGYLETGESAEFPGWHEKWFRIAYGGGGALVYGAVVTASNEDSVPEVQPSSLAAVLRQECSTDPRGEGLTVEV